VPITINDAGEVAFSSVLIPFTGDVGIFTQNRLIVETGAIIDGKRILDFAGGTQFNNVGALAFFARFAGGVGLFSDNSFVLGTGDSVDERVITSFRPWLAINDRGDLAFLANFDDGTAGIVLATVPEPSTVMLLSFTLAFAVPRRSRLRSI